MTTQYRAVLQCIEDYPFPVRFSTGARPRAVQIAARLEQAHRYLSEVLAFDPELRLLVLSPADWFAYTTYPLYGMPHYTARDTIIMGDEPASFWQGVVGMLDGVLNPTQRAEAETTYGTVDGQFDMSTFADLIAVHELGHLFHEQVPFAFPRLWLREMFCNLCVQAYLADREPEQLPRWTLLPARMMAVPVDRVRHRSLDDFERLYVGVGPVNYVWFQFRLAAAARELYDAAGVDALRRLYQTFAAHENESTDQQLAELLEERVHSSAARVMRTWLG
ncbi:MAG: hypothetical protein KJ063_17895 [Anaerolineae bacterium]|nr:hypothetical protein [Anaerolineae bacterium]